MDCKNVYIHKNIFKIFIENNKDKSYLLRI